MTRRKLIVFAFGTMVLAVSGTLIVLLAADLYVHSRAERSAGMNRWGYRGPVAPRKQPGEVRMVMLGGSTTFGYGVRWDESIPALLEARLRALEGGAKFRTINLGFNNEGAYASVPTLEDYGWLDYDIVALYHGYNDSLGDAEVNTAVIRHQSPVFRLTGYFPILPLALQEKAMALRTGGNLEAAYKSAGEGTAPAVTFRPNMAQRTSAAVLESLSNAAHAAARQLEGIAAESTPQPASNESGCQSPWIRFCDSIYRAVKYARDRGVGVLVIGQPTGQRGDYWARLDDQRARLAGMMERHFGNDRGVLFVDVSRAVDPTDPAMSFDGMHLVAAANGKVADALVDPVIRLARRLGK